MLSEVLRSHLNPAFELSLQLLDTAKLQNPSSKSHLIVPRINSNFQSQLFQFDIRYMFFFMVIDIPTYNQEALSAQWWSLVEQLWVLLLLLQEQSLEFSWLLLA